MKKLLTTIALTMAAATGTVLAQQDPQFTQFMYNKLSFNSGYAGTSGGICGALQYRQQWASFDGAPQSIALSGDMALKTLPLGVGINLITDQIGPMSTLVLRAAGSYHIKIGAG
jgi:type IX secretion system PorP/SprF family membrane protein